MTSAPTRCRPSHYRPTWGLAALLALVLGLPACAPQGGRPNIAAPAQEPPRTRVALLLPLSGANAPLGLAMLNAATLALFDRGGTGVELLPRDTAGSPGGAAEATRAALAAGARIVVGPLTAAETQAAGGVARAARIPVLAMTNDAGVAGNGVWSLGVSPAQQVRRVAAAAASGGARRFGLLAPDGPFARQLAQALRAATGELGLAAPVIVTYPAGASAGFAVRDLLQRGGEAGLDAVLLGETGARAREFAAALVAASSTTPPRLLGHGLWAQEAAALAQEPALVGAVFPGPDPGARARFEGRYLEAFGERPSRVAAVAYDATAIGLRALRGTGGFAAVPIGEVIAGADGALRLSADGQVQRALALYALEPSTEPRLVDAALLPGAAGL